MCWLPRGDLPRSGLLIDGRVHGQRPRPGRDALLSCLVIFEISAGAAMHGFSGSPVLVGEQVIGQLVQVIPDPPRGAQFGVVMPATPSAASIIRLGQQNPIGQTSVGAPSRHSSPTMPTGISNARGRAQLSMRWSSLDLVVAVVAPELFGKTWLVQRLLTFARAAGPVVNLNLRALRRCRHDGQLFLFLQELARQVLLDTINVSSERAAEMIEDAWRYSRNPIDNLNRLMESAVLPCFQ